MEKAAIRAKEELAAELGRMHEDEMYAVVERDAAEARGEMDAKLCRKHEEEMEESRRWRT